MPEYKISRLLIPAVLAALVAACDDHGHLLGSDLFKPKTTANAAQPASGSSITVTFPAPADMPPVAAPEVAAPEPALPAAAGSPEATRAFDFPYGDSSTAQGQAGCGFDNLTLPSDVKIFAAGAYSGRELDRQIDQSGHQATQVDVAVNHEADPVVLMLGDYEPTVWNIGWSKKTRIVAVVVSGYHRQVVAGLPGRVPVLISTYDNKGACGYFYVGSDNLASLNPYARRLFDRPVDMVYPAKDGRVVIGDPLGFGTALVTGTGSTVESYLDQKAPLAGQAGIDALVRDGFLREARTDDAQAWVNTQSSLPSYSDLPPVAGVGRPRAPTPGLFHAYVVLKPFVVPAGLYGANAVTFFVPKGVQRPSGNLGHSQLYDFNTLTCAGATCGMH